MLVGVRRAASPGMQEDHKNRPKKKIRLDTEDGTVPTSASPRNLTGERIMYPFESQVIPPLLPNPNPGSAIGRYVDRAALGMDTSSNAAILSSLAGHNQLRIQNPRMDPRLSFPGLMADRAVDSWPMQIAPQRPPFDVSGAALVDQHRLALLRLSALRGGSSSLLEPPIVSNIPAGRSFLNPRLSARNPLGPAQRFEAGNPPFDFPPSSAAVGLHNPETAPGAASTPSNESSRDAFNLAFRGVNIAQNPDLAQQPGSSFFLSESSRSSSSNNPGAPIGAESLATAASLLTLPNPDESQAIQHYAQRTHVPLATDEDQNWLSEFLCFVRSDLVEVFRANQDDVKSRNSSKKVCLGQVGIRCRYCAHLPLSARASRSSSYPSSISRIYQSLTMMLRDHFGACSAIPPPVKQRFVDLKGKTSQGATDSKHYWVHSGHKLGLVDTDSGISVGDCVKSANVSSPPFGATTARPDSTKPVQESTSRVIMLVSAEDRGTVSNFLFALMSQAQLVHMDESEKTGNRKSLPIGLAGFGCIHCCQSNRKGLCRLFPARRRRLGNKVNDLYEHIRRCTLCPVEVKESLAALNKADQDKADKTISEKDFFDRIWARMGHGTKEDDGC